MARSSEFSREAGSQGLYVESLFLCDMRDLDVRDPAANGAIDSGASPPEFEPWLCLSPMWPVSEVPQPAGVCF